MCAVLKLLIQKQTTLARSYYGKLDRDGPIKLILLLKNANNKIDENVKEIDGSELIADDMEEGQVMEGSDLLDVPNWVKTTEPENRQTICMLSIVFVRLVPLKSSVKYEVLDTP